MSVSYTAVGWNRQKKKYDWILAVFCIGWLTVFSALSLIYNADITFETLLIRSTSTLALFLLHIILSIGPLCRINGMFLPLLYNRRHLGVTMFFVAAIHGLFGIVQFHTLGNVGPMVSLFSSNTRYGSLIDFPFQALGFFALIIFFVMAVTSHDFWLHNLGPKIWKTLHMFVYFAYFIIIMHVMLGVIQYETNPVFVLILVIGSLILIVLHLYAGKREVKKDNLKYNLESEGFVKVCNVQDIEEDRAKTFCLNKERIAIFKTEGKLFAVSNVCKHQHGPLGEGKIVDGCITCPWHGYQYFPGNGQSPAPFKEKVSTYDLRLDRTEVWLNPKPFPEGTERPGVQYESVVTERNKDDRRALIYAGASVPAPFYIGWVAKAPRISVVFIKRYLLFMLLLVILLGTVLALSQKPFGTGNFEFGQLTEVKGIYFSKPLACIKVINGNDIYGNPSYQTIPLVGYGKHGADGLIANIEREKGMLLNQREVTLRGTLLYNDGKTLLQVEQKDNPVVIISSKLVPTQLWQHKKELGVFRIRGEIIDPKCFFGVMKPGEGKPHRDCAIRCILGGIAPMLAVKNDKGESNYYILVAANGDKMNEAVQDYVAGPVEMDAKLVQCDDWIIAYVTNKDMIKRCSYLQEKFGNSIQYCAVNCLNKSIKK